MTRAIDRLIVSGRDRSGAWATARRRSAGCSSGSTRDDEVAGGRAPLELERGGARFVSQGRPLRAPPERRARGARAELRSRGGAARALRRAPAGAAATRLGSDARADPGAAAARRAAALVQRARAVRPLLLPVLRRAGARAAAARRERPRRAEGAGARCDRGRRRRPSAARARPARRAGAPAPTSSSDGSRVVPVGHRGRARADRRFRRRLLRVRARAPARGASRHSARAAVRVRARRRPPARSARRPLARRAAARSCSTTRRTSSRARRRPTWSKRIPPAAARLRAGVPEGRGDEVEVVYQFLERPDDVVSTCSRPRTSASSRPSFRRRSRAFAKATSGRHRASSPARTVRRSTSSAPGPPRRSRGSVAPCGSRLSTTSTATSRRSRPCSPIDARGRRCIVVVGDVWRAVAARSSICSSVGALVVRGNGDASDRGRRQQDRRWPRPSVSARSGRASLRVAADPRARRRRSRAHALLSRDAVGRRADPHADHARREVVGAARSRCADIVVCGHTHCSSTGVLSGLRVVNAGQRRHAVPGSARRVLGASRPGVELRRTEYDVGAAVGRDPRATATRCARMLVELARSARRRTSDGVLRVAAWRVATSARRGGAVWAAARADRPDRRAARRGALGRGDRAPLPQRPRAARLGDALRADDRREREPGHAGAVREVPHARGLPRRAGGGARARHLRDRLLPAEGEVDPRDDAHAPRGVRRPGAAAARGSRPAPGRRAQDRERRRRRARRTRRESSSTRTCAGFRSGSG